ncbi:Similar to Sv2b: Synaptic vesicle glycoprotein 2B (Mus musculus) [Cotesia congregata]|uniref:Similar to Sv2b: Synaptic vesicle glycoprotein 2B (Mus musculus) n=1 Tax=Cotesia congregata TaxID=51543 RepID=A0A8J2HJJ2_COTCN|nr:Similar to Sv2b: Synaptic vesicle glycoprotein 2B (Mus musculus) [Cotesia congregata]
MVEGEPHSKPNNKCDVKDNRLNGCGSKDLELAGIGSKGKSLDPEKGSYIKADFEKAIELTEYGKFHYFLLAVCGFVSTSEEMDVISMSFILPSAQCDLNLSTAAKGWLSSIIFIGMMAGAYAWGSVADALGRRKVLIVISFMNALCIVASKFQPKSKRGSMLSFMAAFWTLGNLFVAGLAWLIIPHDIGITSTSFTFNSWRIFLLICAAPSFIVAGLLLLLPESPKYLLSRGRYDEALNIFRNIYAINTGKPRESYTVKELILDDFANSKNIVEPIKSTGGTIGGTKDNNNKKKNKYKIMFGDIMDNSKQLFVSPILRFTVISIIINFTFHIGYYGLMMWFPELFNRFDLFNQRNPNQNTDICQVTEFYIKVKNNITEQDQPCDSKIGEAVFIESLITVASAIPANILAVLGMDRLGRKFFLVFSTLSSGACSVGLYFVYNKVHNVIVSAFFSGVISCGNAALDCLITEVFPTNLRATGIAISMVAARLGGIIGNIVIAQLLDMYCPAPTFIVAALLIGGGLLSLFLPNTTREPLS